MKFSIRDLLLRLLAGPILLPILLLIGGMFVSYSVFGVDLSRLSEDPIERSLPIVGAFGITAVVLMGARYMVREGLKICTQSTPKTTNEPPSWGAPPPLPNSSAPAPIPPKDRAGPHPDP